MWLSAKSVDGLFGAGLLTPPKRLTEGLLFSFHHEWRRPTIVTWRLAMLVAADAGSVCHIMNTDY